ERPAAVASHAAVGVHDDLAAGEPGVSLGTADHEAAGRVHEDIGLPHLESRVAQYRPHHQRDHALAQLAVVDLVGVLGRDHDFADSHGAGAFVDHTDLRLAIGPPPREIPG